MSGVCWAVAYGGSSRKGPYTFDSTWSLRDDGQGQIVLRDSDTGRIIHRRPVAWEEWLIAPGKMLWLIGSQDWTVYIPGPCYVTASLEDDGGTVLYDWPEIARAFVWNGTYTFSLDERVIR